MEVAAERELKLAERESSYISPVLRRVNSSAEPILRGRNRWKILHDMTKTLHDLEMNRYERKLLIGFPKISICGP